MHKLSLDLGVLHLTQVQALLLALRFSALPYSLLFINLPYGQKKKNFKQYI